MKNPTVTTYVQSFTNGLLSAGLTDVVVSPGSRSTPLAYWFAEHPHITLHVQVDERSASFFALGLAKAKQKPVALLCTSGTAAANYYPAIVEAKISRVPLVAITADRPHELRDVGAPQSIEQVNMFGTHVKWATDLPIADGEEKTNEIACFSAKRAMWTAQQLPSGPVHVNVPFREPLIPDLDFVSKEKPETLLQPSFVFHVNNIPASLLHRLQPETRGLFVCGEKMYSQREIELLSLCAKRFQFAIVADPLSNLRYNELLKPYLVDKYDWFLRDERALASLAVDSIIRFGAMPVSKVLTQFIGAHEGVYVTVDETGGYRDPLLSSEIIHASVESFLEAMVEEKSIPFGTRHPWLKWNDVVTPPSLPKEEWSERVIYSYLNTIIPNDSHVFVGNSMPIREVDLFFTKEGTEKKITANRGANGIDGVISTAVGMASDVGHSYLLIGDLSFYHDMNGLLYAAQHHIPITIIMINNDGGGIFSYLPQGKIEKHFETLFGTSTGIKFQHAAAMYGIPYEKVENLSALQKQIENQNGPKMVEIVVDREKHVTQHRDLWKYVSREIDILLSDDEC